MMMLEQELTGKPSPLLTGVRREPELTFTRFTRKPL